jgi:transcriptional regulator with XRE-family HTH domain
MKETGKYEHLSYEERSTIALGLQQGMSVRAIARALGRSPSTISRESRRNAPAAPYNCKFAQQRYQRRRRYSRPQPKLAPESTLFEQVCRLLRRLWSPEQIAGHLATVHGTDQSQRVSHERASQFHQALRLQVLRRTHQLHAARPTGRRGGAQRLRQVQHHGRRALGAGRIQGVSELRGESMQDVIFNGTTTASRPAAPASSWCLTTPTTAPAASGPVRRDFRQARADARRHQQLLHQQPAGAPPRRAGRVPGHGPGAARLRHHRPGHDQPHHRKPPEELRLFLEEAAGVSKYKERRRETENRLSDTRENLTRVEDILRELNANLDKLEKQAEVAQRTNPAGRRRSSSTSCGF